MRRFLTVLVVVALMGCGPRGDISMAPTAAAVGSVQTVFVGTSRVEDPNSVDFSSDRRRGGITFARYDISVPPDRKVGTITWPKKGRQPDIERDFLTTEARVYAGPRPFRDDLRRALAAKPADQREVVVFTHGFNNTFAEGLYRIAQMGNDLQIPGVLVHYSWPSAGKTMAYMRDRDSALFARDGLEQLLNEVADAGARRIVIVGHSMGAALTMETLRQMAIRGDRKVRPRIAAVLLLSPDLDVDVFHEQAKAMGKLPEPFIIFTSRKDKALALSARLTGQRRDRLGNIRSVAEVGDLDVTVVDVAAFNKGDGHLNVATSPALIGILGRIGEMDQAYGLDAAEKTGLLPGVLLSVRNATELVLSPVTGGTE